MFESHYHEQLPKEVKRIFEANRKKAKLALESRLLEKNVTMDGERIMPTSYLPRILPKNYEPIVEKACRLLTEAMLETAYENPLSLNLPGLNRSLIDNMHILEIMPKKAIATCRYDFAISGNPSENNPPKLLEVNCVDYGGTGWVPNTINAFFETLPELSGIVSCKDIIADMAKNFSRMGKKALFITAGETSFPDYALFEREMKNQGIILSSISDDELRAIYDTKKVKFSHNGIDIQTGAIKGHYDFIYPRSFSTRGEIAYLKNILTDIIENSVPVYDNFFGILLENKSAHTSFREEARKLFCEENFEFIDKVFVNSTALDSCLKEELLRNPRNRVLKYSDGHMGKKVFANSAMAPVLKAIKRTSGWLAQDFVEINTAELEPLHSKRFRGIVDLSVYVSYAFDSSKPRGERMEEFSVSGYLCRSSGSSYKVNVSSGGCFVPVFFSK